MTLNVDEMRLLQKDYPELWRELDGYEVGIEHDVSATTYTMTYYDVHGTRERKILDVLQTARDEGDL